MPERECCLIDFALNIQRINDALKKIQNIGIHVLKLNHRYREIHQQP